MRERIRGALTYANVMATLAVFGVLAGGTAIALEANTVGSAQIKPHSVALSDLRDIIHKRTEVAPSAGNDNSDVARLAAKKVTLMKRSGFTVYGKCWRDTDDEEVKSNIYVKTTVNGAMMISYEGDELDDETPVFLKKNTPELDREIDGELTADTGEVDAESHDNNVVLVPAKGGGYLYLNVHSYPKNAPVADGSGPFKSGDRCMFLLESTG